MSQFEIKGQYNTAVVFAHDREEKAIEQIRTLVSQPFVAGKKVRIMPDYHFGAGCTIGFTADLGDIVVPNLVGVDIGCGILVTELGYDQPDLAALDNYIHHNIPPSGFGSYKNPSWNLMRLISSKVRTLYRSKKSANPNRYTGWRKSLHRNCC